MMQLKVLYRSLVRVVVKPEVLHLLSVESAACYN